MTELTREFGCSRRTRPQNKEVSVHVRAQCVADAFFEGQVGMRCAVHTSHNVVGADDSSLHLKMFVKAGLEQGFSKAQVLCLCL